MFRSLSGFKAKYHYLDLMVAADFDEWRVMVRGPGVCIHGARQFGEAKAKEHARACAIDFLKTVTQEELPLLEQLDWQRLEPGEWYTWRP